MSSLYIFKSQCPAYIFLCHRLKNLLTGGGRLWSISSSLNVDTTGGFTGGMATGVFCSICLSRSSGGGGGNSSSGGDTVFYK